MRLQVPTPQLASQSLLLRVPRLECPTRRLPPEGQRPAGDIRHSKETADSLSSNKDFTRLVSVYASTKLMKAMHIAIGSLLMRFVSEL